MEQTVDRLERFRALRARLDPAGDPLRAFGDGTYVERAGAVSARLAAELAIAPASTHLLIGGVGSGKTTELHSAQSRLNQIPDTRAFYVDVSKGHDITKMVAGAVAVQVGLALGEWLSAAAPAEAHTLVHQHSAELRRIAHGYHFEPEPDYDAMYEYEPGILISPDKLEEAVQKSIEPIRLLLDILRTGWRHVVVLLDGLDRMTDMAALERIVDHDIKGLRSIGLGIVLTGPLRALYGMDRTLEQRFDNFHYQPWIDIDSGQGQARAFLENVLRKRIPSTSIEDIGLERLVLFSGGVLRDLLALAQSACLEAYVDGSDIIGAPQTEAAIDSFGRKHMQGLRPADIEVLQRVHKWGNFVHTSEDDLALLMTRRVLEYRVNGRPRYAVHPTIRSFLKERAGDAA